LDPDAEQAEGANDALFMTFVFGMNRAFPGCDDHGVYQEGTLV
jgi:hypothetical protein